MNVQHDAHVKAWLSSCPPNLWNLIRLATQPVLPIPPMSLPNGRNRSRYIAERRREKKEAEKKLVSMYRAGVRHPYLTTVIDLMLRGALLADDPAEAFKQLLSAEPEGRPPEDREATEFEIAVAAQRMISAGVDPTKAYASVAADWKARDPLGARSSSTVQRYHQRQELAAKAQLSWELAPVADLDRALKEFFEQAP